MGHRRARRDRVPCTACSVAARIGRRPLVAELAVLRVRFGWRNLPLSHECAQPLPSPPFLAVARQLHAQSHHLVGGNRHERHLAAYGRPAGLHVLPETEQVGKPALLAPDAFLELTRAIVQGAGQLPVVRMRQPPDFPDRESQVAQDGDAVRLRQLGHGVAAVPRLGVLFGGLEQPHLVVVAQHAHRYAREPGELAYLQHGETSLGPVGRRSIA